MRILLAGVPGILYNPLRLELARCHDVQTLPGDARDRDQCLAAAACDVIVHGMPGLDVPAEAIDAATRGTWNLLTTTRARRYIQLSSMRHFDEYEAGWDVHEGWAPRPTTDPDQLVPYLAEITSRETVRARPVECIILRLDEIVTAEVFAAGPVKPQWLHVDDAVTAITQAVECEEPPEAAGRWKALHIVRGGPASRFELHGALAAPFAYTTTHQGPAEPLSHAVPPAFPPRPPVMSGLPRPRRILLFGAGGPLGAVTAAALRDHHQLRLADLRPLADFATAPPQSPGAPRPQRTAPPHEERLTDITDAAAVRDAAQGADCVVNCTVIRRDPTEAFRVNVIGAYNVMRAAVRSGIPRVVHTGPVLTLAPHPIGYTEDRMVDSSAPPRPGDDLYSITKYAAQEICRIFAERHAIACPTLLFYGFVNPDLPREAEYRPGFGSFLISWSDAGHAMSAAVHVDALPEPSPVIHILADSPHGRYLATAAHDILRWQPHDRLDHLWYRRLG